MSKKDVNQGILERLIEGTKAGKIEWAEILPENNGFRLEPVIQSRVYEATIEGGEDFLLARVSNHEVSLETLMESTNSFCDARRGHDRDLHDQLIHAIWGSQLRTQLIIASDLLEMLEDCLGGE